MKPAFLGQIAIALGLVACSAHAHVSVSRSSVAEGMQMRLHQGQLEHTNSLAALRANMTLTSALHILQEHGSSKPGLMTLVEAAFRNKKAGSSLRSGNIQPATGYSGVDKAKNMLNEMIEEVMEKYDIELQKCCDYDEQTSGLIEEARQSINMFNAQAAEARRDVLEAQGIIQMCESKLPQLNDALEVHNTQCDEETTSLEAQLKIVMEDLSVMDTILGMTTCSKSMFLQRCTDECTGESFVSFADDSLHQTASKVRSQAVKQLINDGLVESYQSGNTSDNMTFTTTLQEGATVLRSGPCKEPLPVDKRTGKCSMSTNPNCEKMQEKFAYIQEGISDKRDELKAQLAKVEFDCGHARENFRGQISEFETRLKDYQTALAAGTKAIAEAEGGSRLKNKELEQLNKGYAQMTTTCHTNYATLESEQCGLEKIRGELYKMQGQNNPAFFQDCVVGEWLPGECSSSCAGGIMTKTRTIMTHPVGGARCPALKEQETCNQQKCPVDCKLADWQGWSACTAKCGGGLQERSRSIMVEPMHGGAACGETTEAFSCNSQSCDRDCELSDWTAWSECSKQCDGGTSKRVKTIVEPSVGDGTCPQVGGEERQEEKPCNQVVCKRLPGKSTLMCESKLDVILLLDGSGSLGRRGWDATVKAGAMLARGFDGSSKQVNIAVLLFSRVSEWVQHFSPDCEGAAKEIEKLTWPRSLTYTSRALNAAKSELSLGRNDAPSVVIVITDGRPMSVRNTRIAARKLRLDARLMWVPVTRWAPTRQMRKWASEPKAENFLALDSFSDLTSPDKLDLIIADVCPNVAR